MPVSYFFFFNDTATTEIYTLSLHDALPISFAAIAGTAYGAQPPDVGVSGVTTGLAGTALSGGSDAVLKPRADRKSTRLNSSHLVISYAVFCLKKKKQPNADAHIQLRKADHL